MSDLNDDLLNYELGDLDDTVLAADEDELLQSDDESSPTKLSQQEEALLLDEDILICPSRQNESPRPEPRINTDQPTSDLNNAVETRDDSVTTTTPEPTTSQFHATEPVNLEPDFHSVHRSPQKRPSEIRAATHKTPTSPEPKSLRVDAPEFVPAHTDSLATNSGEEVEDTATETMSFVSTSTDYVDLLLDDDMVSSQQTTTEDLTETSVSLSIATEDESEVPATTDEELQEPSCSSQSEGAEVKEVASSTGPEESDSDFTNSQVANGSSLLPEMETEDSDEGNERLNPKHRVERERDDQEDTFKKAASSQPSKNFHRNQNRSNRGGFSGRQPLQRFPPQQQFNHYQSSHNENFNLQFQNQFRPLNERGPSLLMNPHTAPIGSNPPLLQFRGHLPPQQQQQHPNYRPVYNPDGNRPRMAGQALLSRHQRPEFPTMNPNQPPFRSFNNGGHGMRPGLLIHSMATRFEMHHRAPRMMNLPGQPLQMSPFMAPRGAPHQSNLPYGGGGVQPQHAIHPAGGAPMMGSVHGASGGPAASGAGTSGGGVPPLIPRKVLINPNFKGGVEAATNQLMMDAMKNPQYMPPGAAAPPISNHDAELLRQQEAFINQNRRHIEKRRHERTPEREHRERSYSPQRRERRAYSRDRDVARKPSGVGGGAHRGNDAGRGGVGRDRRAGSRDPKRRRSNSNDRDGRPQMMRQVKEVEDDETKAYRLMIEKQKSQREKLLKDKEMRRRQAAEGVKVTEDTRPDEASVPATQLVQPNQPAVAQKLTPLVVTEKKIISLKKKDANPTVASNSPSDRVTTTKVVRNIPTAKVYPESKRQTNTMAVVKPVPKSKPVQQSEFEDEDELLADSPSTSPTPGQSVAQKMVVSPSAGLQTSRFSNRRVVLKSTGASADTKTAGNTSKQMDRKSTESPQSTAGPKRVFDRLERKVMNVSDASKRKIQRIVIQNAD